MFIIINKIVFNMFELQVGDIMKFDKSAVLDLYKDNQRFDGKVPYTVKFLFDYAKILKWFKIDGTGFSNPEKIIRDVREGYYFIIQDSKRITCSKLYPTEEKADIARDSLLLKLNRIVSKLYKVEV